MYLRVVHMVDYYNGTEFPNEDEMPNKIGVFHIRGPVETSNSKNSLQDGKNGTADMLWSICN